MERFSRSVPLIGENGLEKLASSRIAVFGLGGVGGAAAEALVRSGIGHLTLVDADKVDITNINRQIAALGSTVGLPKASVMAGRLKDINPSAEIDALELFFDASSLPAFDFSRFDYIIDAIDSIPSKLLLIQTAVSGGIPIISAMGAGNKLDPSRFRAADISKTSVCPLARIMRKKLRELGIEHLKVVFSDEPPRECLSLAGQDRKVPSSIAFVPPVMGYIMAGEAVRDLLKI